MTTNHSQDSASRGTFTPDHWARAAGIPLAAAQVFADDLCELGLAEYVVDNRYRLTPRGVRVLDAIAALPLQGAA